MKRCCARDPNSPPPPHRRKQTARLSPAYLLKREIAYPQRLVTKQLFLLKILERATRIERATLTLARLCSTPELRPRPSGLLMTIGSPVFKTASGGSHK